MADPGSYLCEVCGETGKRNCVGCGQVSFCSPDHEHEYWLERHQFECTLADCDISALFPVACCAGVQTRATHTPGRLRGMQVLMTSHASGAALPRYFANAVRGHPAVVGRRRCGSLKLSAGLRTFNVAPKEAFVYAMYAQAHDLNGRTEHKNVDIADLLLLSKTASGINDASCAAYFLRRIAAVVRCGAVTCAVAKASTMWFHVPSDFVRSCKLIHTDSSSKPTLCTTTSAHSAWNW